MTAGQRAGNWKGELLGAALVLLAWLGIYG